MTTADDFVLQLALDRGLLAASAIDAARVQPAGEPARSLVERLIAGGAVSERALTEVVADAFGHPFVDLRREPPEATALAALPGELARRYRAIPLRLASGGLQVAIADPLDVHAIDALTRAAGRRLDLAVATSSDIDAALGRYFGQPAAPGPSRSSPEVIQAEVPAGDSAADQPVIRLVHELIEEAVRRHASDVHVEPVAQRLRVRYRVDGVLQEGRPIPTEHEPAVVSRLKLIANLSLAERRVPQDGRVRMDLAGRSVDLRVASLPTVQGESVVLRLLSSERLQPDLRELGLDAPSEATLHQLLSRPNGLVLVTGPTGSGKTTTLYSCVQYLNRPDRKIITVEDPIEIQLPGVNQVPVRADAGLTFAAALRAILRQSPNVVMVGEIRDAETAEVALHAALTGHLVFSTLHTNDAPGAITRLLDLGIKPFLVAAALRAAVAQRLVRRVCGACARPDPAQAARLTAVDRERLRLGDATFRRGAGCPQCYGTGYHGRIALFEFFAPDERVHPLIHERAGLDRLRRAARASGWMTLREDGLRKAASGFTTLDEVLLQTVGPAD